EPVIGRLGDVDEVVADLGQGPAVDVEQTEAAALRGQPGDTLQRRPPGRRPHQGGRLRRQVVGRARPGQLTADQRDAVRLSRKLERPGAAVPGAEGVVLAVAQRDAAPGQPEIQRVDVYRLEQRLRQGARPDA